MTSRNPITGDELKTKPSTEKYREGWDKIFGKKKPCSPCGGHACESDKEEDKCKHSSTETS